MRAEICWALLPAESRLSGRRPGVISWLSLVTRQLPSVPQTFGRRRLQRPWSPGRMSGHGWAASGPLQGASGQWPDPSPGTNSPLATAVWTLLQVEVEHPLEQLGPAQPYWVVVRAVRIALGRRSFLGCRLGRLRHLLRHLLRHHQRAQLGVGRQDTVVREAGVRSLAKRSYADTKRIRCSLGLGTSAASRCMNSSGDITRCVVPSRQGVLRAVGGSGVKATTGLLLTPLRTPGS